MNSNISLGNFRAETESYKHFHVAYEDPLTPLSFSMVFDSMVISLSASPYIAFKNNDDRLCLSHVETIRKCGNTGKERRFSIVCNDYSMSDTPVPVKISLKCY